MVINHIQLATIFLDKEIFISIKLSRQIFNIFCYANIENCQTSNWTAHYDRGRSGVLSEHIIGTHQRRWPLQVRGYVQSRHSRAHGTLERLRSTVYQTNGQEKHRFGRKSFCHVSRCRIPVRIDHVGTRYARSSSFLKNVFLLSKQTVINTISNR